MPRYSLATTKKPAVPKTPIKPPTNALSSSTFQGKSAYEAHAQRTFLIHLERLHNAQPSGPFMDPPRDLSFLENTVARNYSNERKGKIVLRENLQLLKRLAMIQSESVDARLKKYITRNVGPPMHSVRYNVRMREKDEIGRENLRLLRRLQTVESEYKVSDFKRERKNIVRLMKMRRQDHTRGHLFASGGGPVTVGSFGKFERLAREAEERQMQSKTKRRVPNEAHYESLNKIPRAKVLTPIHRDDAAGTSPSRHGGGDGSVSLSMSGPLPLAKSASDMLPLETAGAVDAAEALRHTVGAVESGGDLGDKAGETRARMASSKGDAGGKLGRRSALASPPQDASGVGGVGGGGARGGVATGTQRGTGSKDHAVGAKKRRELCLLEKDRTFIVALTEGVKTLPCVIRVFTTQPLTHKSVIRFQIAEDKAVLAETQCTVEEGRRVVEEWKQSEQEKKAKQRAAHKLRGESLEVVDKNEVEGDDGAESSDDEGMDEAELHDLYELLSRMFHEADEDGSGMLDREEFFYLLQDADLGISTHELQLVLSEADEDADGQIDYEEFLPVALDLVQSFRARQIAQRKSKKQNVEISDEALRLLYSGHVEAMVVKVMAGLEKADEGGTGSMARSEFKHVLKKSAMELTKVEMNMVLGSMPHDTFGRIRYKEFPEVMFKVRFTTIKNSIIECRATDTEKLLMKLCKDEELKAIVAQNQGVPFAHPEDIPYTGMISTIQLQNVLTNVILSLNRLQVTSVMCEAEVAEGMVDYWKFVPVGAKAIERMNDPVVLQKKANILKKESIAPEDFLKGKKEDELKEELSELFVHYDADNSGALDRVEFELCLTSLDLGLNPGQINALMSMADTDGTGFIDRDEFMEFGFHHLLHLQKEKHMKQIQASLDSKDNALSVSEDALFRAILDPAGDDNEETLKAIEQDLISIFRQADKDGQGYLTANAFRDVIIAMDLGLSPYQVAVLMTEADKNADGKIQYSEFVPVGLKMLYAYKAKAAAIRKYRERERQADDKAETMMHSLQGQLDSAVHELELAFHAADDSGGLKLLPVDKFVVCLADPRGALPPTEINMVMARMLPDKNGITSYKNFRVVMHQVRRLTTKLNVLAHMPGSTLEKHLVQLFAQKASEEERLMGILGPTEIYDVMVKAKYLNLTRQQLMAVMSLQKECVATDGRDYVYTVGDFARRQREESEMENSLAAMDEAAGGAPQAGTGSGNQQEAREDDAAAAAAAAAASGGASAAAAVADGRTGTLAATVNGDGTGNGGSRDEGGASGSGVRSRGGSKDAESEMRSTPATGANAKLDFRKFAACAAEMISKFFDIKELDQRAKLLSTAKTSSVNLLGGLQQADIEKILLGFFRNEDKRRTGLLDETKFKECLKTIKQLHFDEDDLHELALLAPHDEEGVDPGMIRWKEFMDTAFDDLVDFVRVKESQPKPRVAEQLNQAAQRNAHDSVSESMVTSIARQLLSLVELTAPRGTAHDEPKSPTAALQRPKSRYGIAFEASFRSAADQPTLGGAGMRLDPSGTGESKQGAHRTSMHRRMSRRSTRLLPQELSQQGSSTNLGFQASVSSTGVWSREGALCKLGKGVAVTDAEGLLLNEDMVPTVQGRSKMPARHMVLLEVRQSQESPMHVDVVALNSTIGEEYRATVKMPSLVIVDPQAAFTWARELANRACVRVGDDGRRDLRFDSPLLELPFEG